MPVPRRWPTTWHHFLAGEPIRARPVGNTERLWRWCRRNPVVAGLTISVAALLIFVAIGSSLMSWWLSAALGQSEANRHRAEGAEREAKEKLWQSYRDQARAGRLSRRIGQRLDSLAVLEKAAQLARELDLPEDRFLELRNEAIACLALSDLRPAKEWHSFPAGTEKADFDGKLEQYAWQSMQSGTVSVRRVADDRELYTLPGMGADGGPLFSPDGQYLVIGDQRRLKLWRLAGPSPTLCRQEQDFAAAVFSPDSRQFAVARPEGFVDIYEPASGKLVRHLHVEPSPRHLAFHPRPQQVAVAFRDGARVYDLDTGKKVAEFPLAWDDWPKVQWHPDGKTLAAVGGERIIYLWDVPTGKQIAKLEGFKNSGISFTFNHGGDLLASIAWDGILRLWDPRTGKQLISSRGVIACTGLRFSADDRFLAGQLISDKLRIWEVVGRREYRTQVLDPVLDRGRRFRRGAFRSDGRLLAVGSDDGFGLWDLASSQAAAFLPLSGAPVVLFEPSGALLTNTASGLWRWPLQAEAISPGLMHVGPPQRLPVPGTSLGIARSRDGRVIASTQQWGAYVLHTPPLGVSRSERSAERETPANPADCQALAACGCSIRSRQPQRALGRYG